MAQQTINIGASPNDGTGTPLRTAFQYTNSNFSELYTAVGPSGNNIVVPGNATITGDLTVDTSTLKVDSANNRVGVRTASPAATLSVVGSAGTGNTVAGITGNTDSGLLSIGNDNSNGLAGSQTWTGSAQSYAAAISFGQVNTTGVREQTRTHATLFSTNIQSFGRADLVIATKGSLDNNDPTEKYRIASDGVATWSNVGGVAGTAMTLNATGLGVGGSPASKLYVYGSNVSTIGQLRVDCPAAGTAQQTFAINGTYQGQLFTDGTKFLIGTPNATPIVFRTNLTEALTIDASQNVGIGVTPSAWGTYKGLQVGYASLAGYAGSDTFLGSNVYFDGGAFKYISTATASNYRQLSGVHQWNIAPSGTAGNAITFTQAMTLDASGNLLVGKTASSSTVVGAELRPSGAIISTLAASTNADFALYTYSTGAGAARFYVGMSGTVFATNTTISAISDQRLKENVQDIDVGLGAILALKPRKFDWKEGKGKDIKGDRGFIAQEFEQVFPQLVDEWADPAPEGEAPYKSVRQDLIPVLVKAIQELAARVQTLETR